MDSSDVIPFASPWRRTKPQKLNRVSLWELMIRQPFSCGPVSGAQEHIMARMFVSLEGTPIEGALRTGENIGKN